MAEPTTTQAGQPPAEKKEPAQPLQLMKAGFSFIPQTYQELQGYAKAIAGEKDFIPDAFYQKPNAIMAAWQLGAEVGLPPMAALQSIAVINGRPSIWGDGALAVVKNSPACEWVHELDPAEATRLGYGECSVKRRGDPEVVTRRFTKEMAEKAKLWGGKGSDQAKREQSPWFLYPGRMLQMRARAWALRDAIPEALRGLAVREEILDLEPGEYTMTEDRPAQIARPQRASEAAQQPGETKAEGISETDFPADDALQAGTATVSADEKAKIAAAEASELAKQGEKSGVLQPEQQLNLKNRGK